jgi:hypothetical protein
MYSDGMIPSGSPAAISFQVLFIPGMMHFATITFYRHLNNEEYLAKKRRA